MNTYLDAAPAPTAEQKAKIESLRKEAADQRRREQESWERSDTDGFLSQWANQIGAQLNDRKVALLETGGYAQFPVLVDKDDQVIAEKVYTFSNPRGDWLSPNRRWKVDVEKYGRRWVPVGSTSRIQKQLGLHEEVRWFPAYAAITTGSRKSTGLSGAANAFVATFKRGEGDGER